jgi:hypothetical protein
VAVAQSATHKSDGIAGVSQMIEEDGHFGIDVITNFGTTETLECWELSQAYDTGLHWMHVSHEDMRTAKVVVYSTDPKVKALEFYWEDGSVMVRYSASCAWRPNYGPSVKVAGTPDQRQAIFTRRYDKFHGELDPTLLHKGYYLTPSVKFAKVGKHIYGVSQRKEQPSLQAALNEMLEIEKGLHIALCTIAVRENGTINLDKEMPMFSLVNHHDGRTLMVRWDRIREAYYRGTQMPSTELDLQEGLREPFTLPA